MPATLSYPGVYIEEIPSGVRTITGVATSITAFVGLTRRGPINEPIMINGFADFERVFGGLWESSPLSFAVRDFYLNGGAQAVIVRLYAPLFASDTDRANAILATTAAVQPAADAVSLAAGGEVTTNASATHLTVAKAAEDEVQNLIAANPQLDAASRAAAEQVAAAARAEASKAPYMEDTQRLEISNVPATFPAGADFKLRFMGEKTAAALDPAVLTDATDQTTETAAENALEAALNGLNAMTTAGLSVTVSRNAGPTGFSFDIVFSSFAQPLIEVTDNNVPLTTPVKVSLPLPDAQSVADAASAAAGTASPPGPAVTTAANNANPLNRARLSLGTTAAPFDLEAANPGTWGNQLRARIDHDVTPASTTLFNLTVRDGGTSATETFRNVSVDSAHARYLTRVLEQESKLVRTIGPLPSARPADSGPVAAGTDPFSSTTSTGVTTQASDSNKLSGTDYTGSQANKTGIYALEKIDLFNILCVPPYSFADDVEVSTWEAAAAYCNRRRAMLVVDAPATWLDKDDAKDTASGVASFSALGPHSKNAAVFFPRLRQPNPLRGNQIETFAPCGAVAGVFARTDTQRGVWKAPAGLEATLVGVPQLSVSLTDGENGELNPLAINCLRAMPAAGRVIWGSRTLQGDDRLASEWKYIPVRRLALFLEESLYRGTQWVVFEPNDEPLWAQIRLNLGAFMHNLFRQGAFQGMTPKDAYFVKCDKETTTQNDINLGVVNIVVGFAPLKPAEFVVIKIQQMAGQIET
jgi:phage tail sheath protein FI